MQDKRIKVEVDICDTEVINNSYTIYHIKIKIITDNNKINEYKISKRFSEFLNLKTQLENEFSSELPYEFPSKTFTFWNKKLNSCDPEIVKDRKVKLNFFLSDMMNDSFDTRWKKSSILCHFLGIPSDWCIMLRNHNPCAINDNISLEDDAEDLHKWLEIMRNCKFQLQEALKSGSMETLIRLRLKLIKLEKSLKTIEEHHTLEENDLERCKTLLNILKQNLNQSVSNYLPSHFFMSNQLFSDVVKEPHKQISDGRKFGETEMTLTLNNRELLQYHKDAIKNQDKELEQLKSIIQTQKNLSVEMNNELIAQNELLTLFSDDINVTSNKLYIANNKTRKFNCSKE